MSEVYNYGFVALASLLIATGVTVALTDYAYKCPTTGEVWKFEKLSSTGKTGYWTENGVQKSKLCSVAWEKFVNQPLPEPSPADSNLRCIERCDTIKCTCIGGG